MEWTDHRLGDPRGTKIAAARHPSADSNSPAHTDSQPNTDSPNRDNIVNHLTESHTSPEDAGRIAARAGVKNLVLSHLVPGDSEIPESTWEERARAEFAGNVVCGVDLDQFALSRS